jgi:hypothetical protein
VRTGPVGPLHAGGLTRLEERRHLVLHADRDLGVHVLACRYADESACLWDPWGQQLTEMTS